MPFHRLVSAQRQIAAGYANDDFSFLVRLIDSSLTGDDEGGAKIIKTEALRLFDCLPLSSLPCRHGYCLSWV